MLLNIIFSILWIAPLSVALFPKSISLLYWLMGFIVVVHRYRAKDSLLVLPVNKNFARVLAISFAYMLLSLLWSPVTLDGVNRLLRLCVESYFAYLLVSTFSSLTKVQFEKITRALLGGLFVGGMYLVVEFLFDAPIGQLFGLKGMAVHDDLSEYNRATTYLLILFCSYLFIKSRNVVGIYDWCLLGIVTIVVFLSNSESAKIAFIFAAASGCVAYFVNAKICQRVAQILFLLVIFLFPITMNIMQHNERITEALGQYKRSQIHRLVIWQFAAEKSFEKPLTGWGFNSAYHVPGARDLVPLEVANQGTPKPGITYVQRIPSHTHNFIMQLWLELGLVGVSLASVLFIFFTDKQMLHLSRARNAALCSFIVATFCVASLAYGLWQSQWIDTMLLGFVTLQTSLRGRNTGQK